MAPIGGAFRPSPPTSTPPPSPWPSPSPGIVAPPSPAIVTPPPAHVLYVGRDFVRRGCQTAHWHGSCSAGNEHRAKKGRQSDESYSDVFHGRFLRFAVQMLAPRPRFHRAVRMGTVVYPMRPGTPRWPPSSISAHAAIRAMRGHRQRM